MCFGFSYVGLIWLIMLLVPNFIWTKNQPKDYEKYVVNENKLLLAFERVGQFIVTPVALIFSDFNYKGWNFWLPDLAVSFLCMVLYEIFWLKYFKSEKTMKDFYSNLLGIPVAGATLPVIAFFLLGIYGGNSLMILGSLILGIGHIGIHMQHRREVYGPKKKKKLPVRILLGILKVIFTLVIVAVFGFFTFCIAGRNINQLKRAIKYRNGVNEQIYVQLNDQEEYITIAGTDTSNPVIISLHGGPGAPTTFLDYCWQDYLTDDYTVISWDERGCGRSYYRNADTDSDNKTLSFESQMDDLDALVDYACERFGQDKVIILGHSYGSLLGSRYVLAHPEKVSAYIGVGQVVNEQDFAGETYSYEDALRIAKENGDDTTEMEKAYELFLSDMSNANVINLRNTISKYHPQTVTTDIETMGAITSPIAGIEDMQWYMLEIAALSGDTRFEDLVRPLTETMLDFNALESQDEYQMPVLFLSGSCDWVCPVGMIEEYMDVITAPRMELYLIEGCGHSPQGQLPDEFAKAIIDFLNVEDTGVSENTVVSEDNDFAEETEAIEVNDLDTVEETEADSDESDNSESSSEISDNTDKAIESYGVFLNYDGKLDKLSDYDCIVIDAQYHSAEEISTFKEDGHTVLSYINVGSLEDFRDYYDEYEDLGLGVYENWEDEIWIDVSDERWQSFILDELAPSLADKNIDGFFVDNCDVYYNYPTDEILNGLADIMKGLKSTGLKVVVNGGDTFVDAYTDSLGQWSDVITGINQESVFSCINWDDDTFGTADEEDREYFEDYITRYAVLGADIYLLEYTTDEALIEEIENYCQSHGYNVYVSDSLELSY